MARRIPIYATPCLASMLPPKMVPIGPAEVVWNQTSDACPGLNVWGHIGEQPDSMPDAWHNPLTNQTYLISATDWGTFATVGPSLKHLTHHDCSHRIYTSVNSSLPWDLASHQWLQSSWVFPNGTGAALVHSEFHGGMTGNKSLCSVQKNSGNCQYWSTGLGVTSDGGDTWHLVSDPPSHFTFAVPHRYEKDSALTGFGAIGGLSLDEDSGFFYGHVNQIKAGISMDDNQHNGVCAFRTHDIFNPRAFQGWNGTGWGTTWVSPYEVSPEDIAHGDHVCAVVDAGDPHNGHPNMRKFAGDWRPKDWPSHVMLGWPEGSVNKLAYAYPAWSPGSDSAFTEWTDAAYVDLAGWLDPDIFGAAKLMYPSFLDADSPFELGGGSAEGLSYSLVGNSSLYVYFVIGRKYLARVPVAFVAHDAPDPPVPFPPAPPPSADAQICPQFRISGAGQADVNGDYVRTGQTLSSGYPLFEKDTSHHLYLQKQDGVQSRWTLANHGVGPVYYSKDVNDDLSVPSVGWGKGTSPAPIVTCKNPTTCERFSVIDAGQSDVNGIYVKTDRTANGQPIYEKDSSHQLYTFQKRWKLAHNGVSVYYDTKASHDPTVPVFGWGSGAKPNPMVTCADGISFFV